MYTDATKRAYQAKLKEYSMDRWRWDIEQYERAIKQKEKLLIANIPPNNKFFIYIENTIRDIQQRYPNIKRW